MSKALCTAGDRFIVYNSSTLASYNASALSNPFLMTNTRLYCTVRIYTRRTPMDAKLFPVPSLLPDLRSASPLLNLITQRRHKPHPLALVPIRTPTSHMAPQHLQNLTILPPGGHRTIGGLESADGLRPLAGRPLALDLEVLGGRGAARWVRARQLLLLRRPVVDVPVVFVEEEVVLVEEWARQAG